MTVGTFDWRLLLISTHRWLGIVGGVLFLMWFVSGIVLMYAGMPSLSESERLRRLRPLDLARVAVTPQEAIDAVGASPRQVAISMVGERPAYRFSHLGHWTTVYADTGQRLLGLNRDQAVEIARDFEPSRVAPAHYDQHLSRADQWTIGAISYRPLHRIVFDDPEDTHIYVSDRTGQVILETTARSRRWAYAGAVMHWLYFTPFREHATLWLQTMIWGSILGCVMTLTGLVWGVWCVLLPRRRDFDREERSWSPYSGLMRWHHYAGLVFGCVTFTWILSGCLSLEPFSWHPGTTPTAEQQAAVAGAPYRLQGIAVDDLRSVVAAISQSFTPHELELVQFRGRMFVRAQDGATGRQRLASIGAASAEGLFSRFPDDEVMGAARRAIPSASVTDAHWIDEYDAYYYDRSGTRSLPVLRAKYDDAEETWLYIDPYRGAITRKEERLTRLNRWLYHGLHSLDFPFLYYRRPLWDIVVIGLSLGGVALSVTTLLPAWRRVRRHGRRMVNSLLNLSSS